MGTDWSASCGVDQLWRCMGHPSLPLSLRSYMDRSPTHRGKVRLWQALGVLSNAVADPRALAAAAQMGDADLAKATAAMEGTGEGRHAWLSNACDTSAPTPISMSHSTTPHPLPQLSPATPRISCRGRPPHRHSRRPRRPSDATRHRGCGAWPRHSSRDWWHQTRHSPSPSSHRGWGTSPPSTRQPCHWWQWRHACSCAPPPPPLPAPSSAPSSPASSPGPPATSTACGPWPSSPCSRCWGHTPRGTPPGPWESRAQPGRPTGEGRWARRGRRAWAWRACLRCRPSAPPTKRRSAWWQPWRRTCRPRTPALGWGCRRCSTSRPPHPVTLAKRESRPLRGARRRCSAPCWRSWGQRGGRRWRC